MLGTNASRFTSIDAQVDQTLMSGAPWTSSANGMLNLLVMSYLTMRSRYPNAPVRELARLSQREFRGAFEGDDGLTPCADIDDELIRKLGVALKLEKHNSYRTASFCGIVCPVDGKTIVTDPLKSMCDFFVLSVQKSKMGFNKQAGLLRATAICYKHMYTNVPIIGALADAVLKKTRGHAVRDFDDAHKREVYGHLLRTKFDYRQTAKPTMALRVAIETLYGFTPEFQIRWETAIGLWADDQPHILPSHPRTREFEDHAVRMLETTGAPFSQLHLQCHCDRTAGTRCYLCIALEVPAVGWLLPAEGRVIKKYDKVGRFRDGGLRLPEVVV